MFTISEMTGLRRFFNKGLKNNKIKGEYLPSITLGNVHVVTSQAQRLALAGVIVGEVAKQTDNGKGYILASGTGSNVNDWVEIVGSVVVGSSSNAEVSLTSVRVRPIAVDGTTYNFLVKE